MGARLAGLIVAVLAAACLIVIGRVSFGPPGEVVPSMHVAAAPGAGGGASGDGDGAQKAASASDILAARTRLLGDRTATGPGAFPALSQGRADITMSPGVPDPKQLVSEWTQERGEKTMLRPAGRTDGKAALPYRNAGVLEEPDNRGWRREHNDWMRYAGGWIIGGAVLALALFLFARGRIPLAGGFSGERVERFGAVERANHWMTATAFTFMALSGLIILYGKPLLLPVMGEPAFGRLAWLAGWTHMASAVPFVIGIVVMFILWIAGNIPSRLDLNWLAKGGGFLHDRGEHPPARRFNAGQKIVFWCVTLGGLAALLTGLNLMLPFWWTGYDGMHWAQLIHASVGLLLIALILGHIYIGTIGMVGAIDAMWSGFVDLNWAKEHHKLWLDQLRRPRAQRRSGQTPAE